MKVQSETGGPKKRSFTKRGGEYIAGISVEDFGSGPKRKKMTANEYRRYMARQGMVFSKVEC